MGEEEFVRRSHVNVIAPVIVAALGNGNNIVNAIDIVDNQGSIARVRKHRASGSS